MGFAARKGILFWTFSLGKGICFMAILVKEKSNFDNSCLETKKIWWSREGENLATFVKKTPIHGTFDVEFSLAKGIIFTAIGLANGSILKL